MKITIKETKQVEVEFKLPLFFDKKYVGSVGIFSETKAVIVSKGFFSIYDNFNSIKILLSDYKPENQITKEEFEKVFNKAKENVNNFQL
jgi:hypothetical protein